MAVAPEDAGHFRDQDSPVNLTEAASSMSWSDACATMRISRTAQSVGLVIQPLDVGEKGPPNDGLSDTIYFIISGYGTLHCDNKKMDCTAGDVLFIPQGTPHRFERMDGEIRIWRIELLQVAADGK
jgi:mannose-6-phosphate isomerase-like protein (cupin superfamily)